MTLTAASHFKNDAKFRQAGWLCVGCPSVLQPGASPTHSLTPTPTPTPGLAKIDTQEHLMHCGGYSDLREGLDLETDRDLVTYFKLVIERRLRNEDT